MVVLTFAGRRLKVTHLDKRRGVVHYREVFNAPTMPSTSRLGHYANFSTFASVVESVLE